jgi:hypothetical protein
MKRYIKSSMERPYLYIFKHGLGPGTLPHDVNIVKTKDLPRGYTAVWTDRFLTTQEMDQYDIPYETEINRYLDRIGYCQKNGDVVPCDDVEVCDKVTGATDVTDDQVKFFYKGKFLGACDPEYIECPKLLELMKSDRDAATQVLAYMNSLGDPVFPVSEEDWDVPETNIDNIDIDDLYNTFMQELQYNYADLSDSDTFMVGLDYVMPDFEIFTGAVAGV